MNWCQVYLDYLYHPKTSHIDRQHREYIFPVFSFTSCAFVMAAYSVDGQAVCVCIFASPLLSSGFLLSSSIAIDVSGPGDLRGVGLAILSGFVSEFLSCSGSM